MKTNLKRILSVICALALCVGLLPMSALAAEEDAAARWPGGHDWKDSAVIYLEGDHAPSWGTRVDVTVGGEKISPSPEVDILKRVKIEGSFEIGDKVTVSYEDYRGTTYEGSAWLEDGGWLSGHDYEATISSWDWSHGGGGQDSYGSQTFDVYYLIGDNYPNPLYSDGAAIDYGPGRNDTPMCSLTIDVDALITALQERYPGEDVVVHNYNGGGQRTWAITPETCGVTDPDDYDEWWAVVMEHMTHDSKAALEATGLADQFVGYVLKNQENGGDYHLDGRLTVEPPVYSVELYLNDEYVGGIVESNYKATFAEVRDAYEEYIESAFPGEFVVFDWTDATFTVAGVTYQLEEGRHNPNQTSTVASGNNSEVSYETLRDDVSFRAQFFLTYEETTPKYNGSEVTVQVYVDGKPVNNPYDYIELDRYTGRGDSYSAWTESRPDDDGIITCDFNYNPDPESGHDCVDINVTLADGDYILQGVTYHQSYGSGNPKEVAENDGVYTIDNVTAVGNSDDPDVTIYLYTKYSVEYYVDGGPSDDITDGNVYITGENVTDEMVANSTKPTTERVPQWMHWKNTGYATTVTLTELPENTAETVYAGWFTTEDGSTEHSASYTGEGIQTAAANSGDSTPTVIECYATTNAATGILTVTKMVNGLETLPDGFTITVSSEKLTSDIVMDVDDATKGDSSTYTWTINNLAPGEYTVTESGYEVEGYNVTADGPETATVVAGQTVTAELTNTYEKHDPELTVEKSIENVTKPDGTVYPSIPEKVEVGDTITYKILVENTGNVPLTNVTVTDTMEGGRSVTFGTLPEGVTNNSGTLTISNLAEEAKVEITAAYTVTENDKGVTLTNTAVAQNDDTAGKDEVPVEVKNQYTITYTVTNGNASGAGITNETSGTITVNEGDDVILNFTANEGFALDSVMVDNTPYEVDRDKFESYEFENVTANHKIVVVYAEDKIGPDDEPDGIPDKYQVTVKYVADKGGSIKDSTQEVLTIKDNNGKFAETGNVTAKGATATADSGYFFTGWTLSVNGGDPIDSQIFGATTGAIFLKNVHGGQTYIYTANFKEKVYDLETTKTLISVGGTTVSDPANPPMAKVGDDIVWTITVENTGNQPLPNVTVSDLMINASGAVSLTSDTDGVTFNGTTATIPTLEAGQTVTITATYTVQPEDAGKALNNRALVNVDGNTDDDVTPEKPVTVEKKDLEITKTADRETANRGDTITYTITVTNTGNVELKDVTVSDEMMVGSATVSSNGIALPDVGVDGSCEIGTLAVGQTVTIIYTHEVTAEDVEANEIKNVATVSSSDLPDEMPEDEVTISTHDYTVTITPADITIYTGGEVYGGVVDADGEEITNASGLPEPGYYLVLSDDVENWLSTQSPDDAADESDEHADAKNLADVLRFRYYDTEGNVLRDWGLVYQGVYSRYPDGTVAQYVYSLTPNRSEVEKGTEVRLAFTNDGHIVSSDTIYMDSDTVYADYEMTIYGGGLEQSDIVAELSTGEDEDAKTITCNVEIGTGNLIVRSVVNQENNTNEIAASTNAVDNNAITAVADEDVTYYVNNSEVEVGSDRVQLLVDKVSNSDEFNADMGEDAINHVNKSLSNAAYESAYLDLVDTENGNTVVTMGENEDGSEQSLTIYWPVPDDAAADSEFHIVHYTGMDRETIIGEEDLDGAEKATPEVKIVTIDNQKYVTFSTDSFSPFVLVYEQEESRPVNPPHGGDDDDDGGSRPSHRPSRPDRDEEPEDLNTEDHVAYLIGFTDGTIRPEADITRAEVATIFFRLLTDEARETYWSQTNAYSDVAPDAWYNNAVSTLTNMGILDGYLDGTFRPNAPITRSEFTKIAVSFFDYTAGEYSYEGWFSDVQGGEWFVEYLTAAMRFGLIEGMPDGTFRPLDNITRAEACTIVNRTLGREPHEDYLLSERRMNTWPDNSTTAWYYADMQEATNSHDYYWDEDDEVEEWTEKLEERDWAALERSWSNAYDAPGGEVMD